MVEMCGTCTWRLKIEGLPSRGSEVTLLHMHFWGTASSRSKRPANFPQIRTFNYNIFSFLLGLPGHSERKLMFR